MAQQSGRFRLDEIVEAPPAQAGQFRLDDIVLEAPPPQPPTVPPPGSGGRGTGLALGPSRPRTWSPFARFGGPAPAPTPPPLRTPPVQRPTDEQSFRAWYADRAQRYGLDPNPDDWRHFYDYRAAFRAGAEPAVDPTDGLPHWPSEFKKEGHPNLIVNGIDTRTGKPAATAPPLRTPPVQADARPGQPAAPRPPGAVARAWEAANAPIVPAFAEAGQSFSESLREPSEFKTKLDHVLTVLTGTRPGELRGFAAGALEGMGKVASSFTSPASVFATMAGVAGPKAAAASLPELAQALRVAEGGAAAVFAGDSARQLTEAPDVETGFAALAGLAGGVGGAGAAGHALRTAPRTPQLAPPVKPNVLERMTRTQDEPAAAPAPPAAAKGSGQFRPDDVAPAPTTPRAGADVPPDVAELPPAAIQVDPARFQFKSHADDQGVTASARLGGPWNKNLAGVLLVWRDPADGKTYVVNGHHRLEAAKRLGAPSVLVRYVDAATPEEARLTGALTNIAEDKGTAIDAAKIVRATSPDDLAAAGISPRAKLAKDGIALAQLSDPLFQRVATGELDEAIGVAIGEAKLSPENQAAVVQLVERQAAKGRELTPRQVRALIQDVQAAPSVNKADDQINMFAQLLGEDRSQSVAVEKAVLRDWLMQTLGRDKRLFGFVSKADRAEKLLTAGVGKLDTKASQAQAQQAAIIADVVDRLAQSAGPVSDALTRAATRVAGGEQLAGVRSDLLTAVRAAVESELAGVAPGANRAAAPPSRPVGPEPDSAGPHPPAGPGDVAPPPAAAPPTKAGPPVTREAVESAYRTKEYGKGPADNFDRQVIEREAKRLGDIIDTLTARPWVRLKDLPGKHRDLTGLRELGSVVVAWDRHGDPHYAIAGAAVPDRLNTAPDDAWFNPDASPKAAPTPSALPTPKAPQAKGGRHAEKVDRYDTGELQPRLPGDVGDVRDVELQAAPLMPGFEPPKFEPGTTVEARAAFGRGIFGPGERTTINRVIPGKEVWVNVGGPIPPIRLKWDEAQRVLKEVDLKRAPEPPKAASVDDLTARRLGMPSDLANDLSLQAEYSTWRRAVTTPGASVRHKDGFIGSVVRGAEKPDKLGDDPRNMVLVEHEYQGQPAQRWYRALDLEPAPEAPPAPKRNVLDELLAKREAQQAATKKPKAVDLFDEDAKGDRLFDPATAATKSPANIQIGIGDPTRPLYERAPPRAAAPSAKASRRAVSEPELVERLQDLFGIPQRSNVLERLAFGNPTRRLPVRRGRDPILSQAYGVYMSPSAMIRLRKHGDLTTFSHELGHHIDLAMFDEVGKPIGLFKQELLDLGIPTTPKSQRGKPYNLKEGVAEYFRLRFADPAQAKQRAPEFTRALQAVMDQAPGFERQIREAEGLVQRYLAQPADVRGTARVNVAPLGLTGRVKDVLSEFKSNTERGSWRRRAHFALRDTGNLPSALADRRAAFDRQITKHVDKHQAIWRALRDNGKDLPAAANAYTLARLADKSASMAEGFVRVGPRGKDGTFTGASLEAALRPMHHRMLPDRTHPDRPDLASYLIALRAAELHNEGKGRWPGMTPDEAKSIIQRTAADPEFEGFKAAAKGVYSYLSGLRHYARQYGAFSGRQVKNLEKSVFYVPLQRVRDQAADVQPGSAKYADRQSPIKRLVGSGRDVIDPIESIVKNTFGLVSFVERNRAAKALVDSVGGTRGSGAILQEIQGPKEQTKFNLKQVQNDVLKIMVDQGLVDPDELFAQKVSGKLDSMFDELVTVYTPSAFGRPNERILFVMDNGERRFFQIQNEALYQNLVGLGPGPTTELWKLAGKAANILRAGVTVRPTFVLRNLVRDTVGAFFQSRHGFLPGYDTARGLVGMLRNDDDFKRFLAWGVQQSTLLGQDRKQLRAAIDRATSPDTWGSKLYRPVRHPIEFLQEFSSAVETATRLGEFKLALDTGGKERRAGVLGALQRAKDVSKKRPALTEDTMTTAALAASDVTVDFSRGGTWAKEFSKFGAFYNARLHGLVRAGETIARDPVGTALTAGALAAASAILWQWNKDDEHYQELDETRKRDNWFIRLPGTEHWIVAPKPFVWSAFANLTEEALEEAQRDRPEALHPLRDFVQQSGRELIQTLMPTIVMPTLEALTNKDIYRNRPIVPHWTESKEPDLQVNDWTSETFRALGSALGLSPAKLEHFARRTGGGMVGDITSGTDVLARLATQAPERPAAGVERIPGVQALIAPRRIDSRASSVEDFYARWNDLQKAELSLKAYSKGAGRTDAAGYAERVRKTWAPDFAARMKAAKKQIDELRDQVDEVEASPLSAQDKRTRLDRLHAEIARVARFGLEGTRR